MSKAVHSASPFQLMQGQMCFCFVNIAENKKRLFICGNCLPVFAHRRPVVVQLLPRLDDDAR